jgi:hypothetical protein
VAKPAMTKNPAQVLLDHFKSDFLRGLASRDERILDSLCRAHCAVTDDSRPPYVRFKLSELFDALCILAQASDAEVSFNDWNSTFKKFCDLLVSRWPWDAIAGAGYNVGLFHRGNSLAATSYELVPRDGSSK